MKTALRCAVATFLKLWPRYVTLRLACSGGQAIRTLRLLAVGWLPSRYRLWPSSGLHWKTKWPCIEWHIIDKPKAMDHPDSAVMSFIRGHAPGLLRRLYLLEQKGMIAFFDSKDIV